MLTNRHFEGAHFKAINEGILMAPLDSRYTQVGFNLISAQVCLPRIQRYHRNILYKSLEMSLQLFISVGYLAMHQYRFMACLCIKSALGLALNGPSVEKHSFQFP